MIQNNMLFKFSWFIEGTTEKVFYFYKSDVKKYMLVKIEFKPCLHWRSLAQ